MGEADFNRFTRLRNQLVNAAENFAREEILSPVLISTMSKDMGEQLKLAHNVVDVVERANRKICVTLPRYNVDKLRVLMLKFDSLQGRRRTKSFNNINFLYLLDVMISVNDKGITNQPICKVFKR